MAFKRVDTSKTSQEILHRILYSGESQLVIPPNLVNKFPIISSINPNEVMIGLFSSGTTARPKCIWNSLDNLKTNALNTAKSFGIDSSHSLLICAAPWHVAGISWAIMAELVGCEYEFVKTQKGEDELWLEKVQHTKADYLLTVPAVLRALFEKEWFIENVVFGGYAITENDLKLLAKHSNYMRQGYGMTEAGGLIASHCIRSKKTPREDEFLCCGRAISGVEIQCKGLKSNPKEVYIRSNTAFTKEWFNTRDLGYLDKDQNLYLMGRKDTIVNQK